MLRLPLPPHTTKSTYTACISKVRDKDLAGRLADATPSVIAAAKQFDLAARLGNLHSIKSHTTVAPAVTGKEMEKVYTQRMAQKDSPGRHVYDEIFASSPYGRCPLCVQRSVATLDHHLPKTQFPALAVAPRNLIPSCSDCNKSKLSSVPSTPEEVGLHPYYDDLGHGIWLKASVVETSPTALRFRVVKPSGWSVLLHARVCNHFRSLGLAGLYTSEAAEELINIRHQLEIVSAADPADGVRNDLARRALSCAKARPNGWRTAAYCAWRDSDWFCDGGFA